jgi:hypothetical protein
MSGLFSSPAPPPPPPPPPVAEPTPRPASRVDEERAAATRARRLSARPLISGSPLGVQTGGLQTTLGPPRVA